MCFIIMWGGKADRVGVPRTNRAQAPGGRPNQEWEPFLPGSLEATVGRRAHPCNEFFEAGTNIDGDAAANIPVDNSSFREHPNL